MVWYWLKLVFGILRQISLHLVDLSRQTYGFPVDNKSEEHLKVVDGIFYWEDSDKDGFITHEEFTGPKHDELWFYLSIFLNLSYFPQLPITHKIHSSIIYRYYLIALFIENYHLKNYYFLKLFLFFLHVHIIISHSCDKWSDFTFPIWYLFLRNVQNV